MSEAPAQSTAAAAVEPLDADVPPLSLVREPGPRQDPHKSVLGKARLILEAFSVERDQLSLSELARETGIAKATVHRLAQDLIDWGVLERRGTDYQLGMRLFELGQNVSRQRLLRDLCRPYMEYLLKATNETVHLGVRDGLDVLYVEKLSSNALTARPTRVAGRMPLHCTATGRVLLADAGPDVLRDVVHSGLSPFTSHTITSPRRLREELRRIRQDRVTVEREEIRVGYLSVAVPLVGADGGTVAALSITAIAARADVRRYSHLLESVSRAISQAMERSAFGD